jgi:hypothetical protein
LTAIWRKKCPLWVVGEILVELLLLLQSFAIKIEYGGIQSLKHEVKIMNYLATSGVKQIPNIYWYGIHNNSPCLVFTLYECSIFDYMEKKVITIDECKSLNELIEFVKTNEQFNEYQIKQSNPISIGSTALYRGGINETFNNNNWTNK